MTMTTEIKLKPEINQEIRNNQDCKNRLQLELKISHSTLYRLLNSNSDKLTTAKTLKILREEFNKTNDQLLTEEA